MKALVPICFCSAVLAMSGPKSCSNDPVHKNLLPDEYPTRYILFLGDGTNYAKLKGSRQDLMAALPKSETSWHSEIKTTFPEGKIDPRGFATRPIKTNVTLFRTTQISHPGGAAPDIPCTQHVTQKIGTDNLAELEKVLEQLEP